jgi:hypothetical protein
MCTHVLVHLKCHYKMLPTGYLTHKCISHSFEGLVVQVQGASKFNVWWEPVPHRWHLLTTFSHDERGKTALWVPFKRLLIPFIRLLFSWPSHPPKTSPLNVLIWRSYISIYKFKGGTNVQTVALYHFNFIISIFQYLFD